MGCCLWSLHFAGLVECGSKWNLWWRGCWRRGIIDLGSKIKSEQCAKKNQTSWEVFIQTWIPSNLNQAHWFLHIGWMQTANCKHTAGYLPILHKLQERKQFVSKVSDQKYLDRELEKRQNGEEADQDLQGIQLFMIFLPGALRATARWREPTWGAVTSSCIDW